jgi:hypothetical protein
MTNSLTQPNIVKPNFRLSCEARAAGSLNVSAEHVAFTIALRVRLDGEERLWESAQLNCHTEDDGSLTIQVLVWDPKVEDTIQIAFLRSRPDMNSENSRSLEFDLRQKRII